jgi:hypothetical protein
MWPWFVLLWFVLAITPLILGFLKKVEFRWALLWLAVFFSPLTLLALLMLLFSRKNIEMKR